MKLIACLLSLCLLLTGCGKEDSLAETEHITLPVATEETETSQPTEETETPEASQPVVQEFSEDAMVPVLTFVPDLLVELKYATADNFTGNVIYDSWGPFLRYGTLEKLMEADYQLREMDLRLKLWDGFRPVSAQAKLWAVYPDKNYVSHPETGYRGHCRGNAVDVTLSDAEGRELEMPSGFDDFSALADWDFSDCSDIAAENAKLLRTVMENCGFDAYQSEWWHFTDSTVYPVEETFQPVSPMVLCSLCEEYITLRSAPSTSADEILQIPAGEEMELLAQDGDFYYVSYQGVLGYVLQAYTGTETLDNEPEVVEEIQLNRPWYYANCKDFVSLRERPDVNAAVLTQIPAGEKVQLLEYEDRFGFVDYQGIYGYVLLEYIEPVQ